MQASASATPILVQPSWLHEQLRDGGKGSSSVRVLDASWYLPSMGAPPLEHSPGVSALLLA